MSHCENGVICTNDNCIGCNKCLSVCPVEGANISVLGEEGLRIENDSEKCINCGACVNICTHNAREYKDDTERFISDLKNGKKISLLVDPVFYYQYFNEASKIFGYLKSLGVGKIYDISFGVEVSVWGHAKYIRENLNNPARAFVGNSCNALISYFKKHEPKMLDAVIPVHSPTMCTAIYAKNYLHDENDYALLSPCSSKMDDDEEYTSFIKYNVCIEKFMNEIASVDFAEYEDITADLTAKGPGMLFTMEGGFKHLVDMVSPNMITSVKHDVVDRIYISHLREAVIEGISLPNFVDFVACSNGCVGGSGISGVIDYKKVNINIANIKQSIKNPIRGIGGPDGNYERLCELTKDLTIDDFTRKYTATPVEPYFISESECNRAFEELHKDTKEKQTIDCGACGYSSCKNMARAIAAGINKKENCIRYVNDELSLRYYTDSLTRINNKEGFIRSVKYLYAEKPDVKYVIGVVALNQLNVINDLYGFETGDEIIRRCAGVAKRFTTGKGVCGRLGGGEFLVCFECCEELLERIHSTKVYAFEDMDITVPLTYRAGLFIDADRSNSIETMINYASLARDKIEEDAVCTCLYYNNELRERLAAEAMVTSQMYAALENHEFVAYYQPQYSSATHTIVGAETLCRWIKKDGSVISPGLFIPIFEKNGFIKSLDRYMWEDAFKTVLKWKEELRNPVPISVNISRVSLDESDFIDTIQELAEKYPIDRKLLHFEITESAYSERQDVVTQKVNALRDMGFVVALDDFGSGYSSLNVLKDMPIDILKLDMGFLRGKNQDNGEIIIRNVVSMISELDLDIVSEGVETNAQADFLTDVGVDVIQGYLYARPMPKDDYEKILDSDRQVK